ncbi:cytochrome D1 domain-containing protein [Paracoccus sp. (in: a-proteobacteria)]|uniref:cytochrome D1 domain-containing protein n=1 Tax=Paracoccus sp. TaxID=267 RepID=UPI0026DF39ED|nr:cytochrome D1 domain-containing protein [Paracoccus sp. (in: a-proteobacteria)]MDO5647876.1 cytochrome D1 domain-containing protein [Paracoccus sp. (in: a-proteobacteria)]
MKPLFSVIAAALLALPAWADDTITTGEMGVVIERATGSVLIVSHTKRATIARIDGLGDLSHASVTFSPDQRFAYVFGRDGGLTQIDMTTQTIANRIIQGGNSIGGAISDDGRLVAVSNYEPGGVKVFDAQTLELVSDIAMNSKTVGLADVPGGRFIVATWDTGQAWLLDPSTDPENPVVAVIDGVGANPYDALMTGNGRNYIIGLFGEKGLTAIDLWSDDPQPVRFLPDYGKDQDDLPVYKMPHLQGWTLAGDTFALPAVGLHQLLWVDAATLGETGRTDLHGQPIFALARPDEREIWVNFAPPHNDTLQVIDTMTHDVIQTLTPGPGVLHMEFTPRGREVWLSVRDENRIEIRDTHSYQVIDSIPAQAPSGIFFTDRAYRLGL